MGGYIDVFEVDEEGNLTLSGTHEMYNQKGPARCLYAERIY
jgi:hypothetical protein